MQDQFSEILFLVKGVIRNKWIITIVAWVVCSAGWAYVHKMPDVYESSARVHVDTRTMLRPLLKGMAVQTDVKGLIMIMKKLMFTQFNMIKVAELAGIDVTGTENQINSIVKDLKDQVQINGGKRDEIFQIISSSDSPLEAKTIVQSVLTVFSEQTQKSSLNDVDSAQRFLDVEIKEYEQRLRNAERAKENFKRENIGLLPGDPGAGQIGAIQMLRRNLETAELKLSELRSKKKVLKIQLSEALNSGDEWGLTEVFDTNTNSIGNSRLALLEDNKILLLLKYTEKHPKIIAIQKIIDAINAEEAEKNLVSLDVEGFIIPSEKAMANPYVQTIKVGINDVDTEMATINSRVNSYKKRMIKEDEQFNSRLAIETEMQNLNRDYASIKKNYLVLIDRREKARLSSRLDSQVSTLKFKIIDPANLPLNPSSPKRKVLYTVVLIAGFVVGIALALLKIILRPTFSGAKQVRDDTQLPVLGVITEVINEDQLKRNQKKMLLYGFANIVLVVGYVGVMLTDILP